MKPLATLASTLLLATAAHAGGGGTIDATQYLPMGHFNVWEMIDATDLVTGTTQNISVRQTTIVDDLPRYNIRTKIFDEYADLILQFGVEGNTLYLYGARVVADVDFEDIDDASISTMFFTPPVPVGTTSTTLDLAPVQTAVTSSVKVKIKIGPKTFSETVDVVGTVSSRWLSTGDVLTGLGLVSGTDLARLELRFVFNYSSTDDDVNDAIEDETTDKTVAGIMGTDMGFVQIDGNGGTQMVLNRAILPGMTLGDFPPLTVDLHQLVVDTPLLFNLFYGGSEGGVHTDGFVSLSNVEIEQNLGGKSFLRADIDVAGGEGTPVNVEFKGKTKFKKDGSAAVSFKGKTTHPALTKKLVMKIKSTVTADSTEMVLSYKAGKDEEGNPIAGEIMIPIAPEAVDDIALELNKLTDVKFDPNPLKRKLGAEGTLTIGSKVVPVTMFESVKVKEGQPEKRGYKLVPSGTGKPTLLKFSASNTDATDYVIAKLKGKLLGYKVKPDDPSSLPVTLDDE